MLMAVLELLVIEDEVTNLDRLVEVAKSVGFEVTVCSALDEA